jgi:hypothetical protein
LRPFPACIIKWGNPELENEFAGVAGLEIIAKGAIRIRQLLGVQGATPVLEVEVKNIHDALVH